MKTHAQMIKNQYKAWVLFFVLISAIFSFHKYYLVSKPFVPPKALLVPPEITHFTFGFAEQIADNLWIRAIQDFDFCEQKIAENICKNESWLYHMLNLIVDLSPHFRMPQATGPVALTILVSDIQGASKLFDRAVENFPSDWPILYRAAYQAMEEEKNYSKAADLLQRAAKNGGPSWFYSLAGRLYTKEGRYDLAELLYKDISRDPDLKKAAEKLSKSLANKKSEIETAPSQEKTK